MGTPAVTAFPYRRWQRLRRAEVLGLRRVLRATSSEGLLRAQAEAEALLGERTRLHAGAPALWSTGEARAALAAGTLALWLERRVGARDVAIVCELAPELGARLVDRVLGGEGGTGHVPGGALDELSAGVLAYLVARMAAAAGGELRLRGVLQDGARAAALLGEGGVLVLPFALELAGRGCGGTRAFIAQDGAALLASEVGAQAERPVLPAWLRGVPVTLCAHAARVTLKQSELQSLGRGDVVLPERCALVRRGDGFAGAVWLHAIGSSRGGLRCTADGDALTIEQLIATGEEPMTEGKRIETQALDTSGDALRAAGDAPIELCLELARFTLPLGELSALRPGEVLSTGRAIGELCTLSAGGRAFARGELCDVEGEIGVRVTELLG